MSMQTLREHFGKTGPAAIAGLTLLALTAFPAAAHGQTGPAPNDNRPTSMEASQTGEKSIMRQAGEYSEENNVISVFVLRVGDVPHTDEQIADVFRPKFDEYDVPGKVFVDHRPSPEPGKNGMAVMVFVNGEMVSDGAVAAQAAGNLLQDAVVQYRRNNGTGTIASLEGLER